MTGHSRTSTLRWMVTVAVATAITACSSSSSPTAAPTSSSASPSPTSLSVAAYMHAFCTAVTTHIHDIEKVSKAYEAKVGHDAAQGGLPAAKRDTIAYFDRVSEDFTAIVAGVRDAGTPPVSGGAHIRAAVLTQFERLASTIRRAAADVRHLSTTDPSAFQHRLVHDGRAVSKAGDKLESGLDALDVDRPELDQAAKKDPVCRKMG